MLAAIVESNKVASKTYFLEIINTPFVIYPIRLVAAGLAVYFLVYFWKHRGE